MLAAIFIAGGACGALITYFAGAQSGGGNSAPGGAGTVVADNYQLLRRAYEVAEYLKNNNYDALSKAADSVQGVTFVPYSTVVPGTSLKFMPDQIAKFADDSTAYVWGTTSGDAKPISLTPADYIAQYVFAKDYTTSANIGINAIVKSGNALENLEKVFPGSQYVDFNFPGFDEKQDGLDWCSLKLVFTGSTPPEGQTEPSEPFKLIAIINGEWTVYLTFLPLFQE